MTHRHIGDTGSTWADSGSSKTGPQNGGVYYGLLAAENDIIVRIQTDSYGKLSFYRRQTLFRCVWDCRWFSPFVIMYQFRRTGAQRRSKKHLHGAHLLCSDICILTGSTVPALGGALRRRCVFLLEIQLTVR